MAAEEVYGFAADETHTFEFSMAVPMGTGGKTGAVVAEVLDPNGNKLVDGSLDVVIAAPALPEFAYVSDIKRGYYSASHDYFTVDVQNVSDVAGTCTLEFWTKHKYDRNGPVSTEWELYTTVSHTLQPGEIGTFGHDKECRCNVIGWPSHLRWYVKFVGEPGEISKDGRAWA